jgi:hypothetical protein
VNIKIKIASFSRMIPTFSLLVFLSFCCSSYASEAEKDTFSISLVQEATVSKDDVGKGPYEHYKVKKDDYLWKILRNKGMIPGPDIEELISAIKAMNPSLKNLDLMHPGQTVLIPLKIVPKGSYESKNDESFQKSVMGFSSLEGVNLENYLVKPGDNITKIVIGKYTIPPEYLYAEYLDLVRMFNPAMEDPDLIYPNQVIRLPIYSPEIVRAPIEGYLKQESESKIALTEADNLGGSSAREHPKTISLAGKLRDIFDQIGEEWVDSGEQFIPLKSGGHVKLEADAFPTLNLRNGRMLIIDLRKELPEDITKLIESDWQSYKVVRLAPDETLKTALDKLFTDSGYHKVLRSGEHLELRSEIDISLAGDWIIIPQKAAGNNLDDITVLNLINDSIERTPFTVKRYLKRLGVTVRDYPDLAPSQKPEENKIPEKVSFENENCSSLPTLLLDLSGQPFSRDVKIPVYQSGGSGFNLIIHADIFFNRAGSDCIIDTTGLSPEIIELLAKHGFRVLSIAYEKDPGKTTELVLDFLDMEFDAKSHDFMVSSRDEARNITLTLQGIRFTDKDNRKLLATDTPLPDEIVSFLNQKSYLLLELRKPQVI